MGLLSLLKGGFRRRLGRLGSFRFSLY